MEGRKKGRMKGWNTPGQGAPPNSNLPPALISTELSGLLTEKLRVVAKVYKMAAKSCLCPSPFAWKSGKLFSVRRGSERDHNVSF